MRLVTLAQQKPLWVLAVIYFLSFASGGIQLPLTALAMENIGLSSSSIGAMWSARSLAGAFSPLLWGIVADKMGTTKPLLVLSLLFGATLLWALSTATQATPTVWCVILFGLFGLLNPSSSLTDGTVMTVLGDNKHQFGKWRAVGTVGFGVSTVCVTAMLDAGWLQPTPRALFSCCAVLCVLAAFVALLLPAVRKPPLSDPRDFLVVAKMPAVMGLVMCGCVLWASHQGYAVFLSTMNTRAGLPQSIIGITIASAVVVETISMTSAGFFVQRFGHARILLWACLLSVLRWVLLALFTSTWLVVAAHAMHGFSFGLFFVVGSAALAERVPARLSQAAQGLFASLSFGLGGFLGSAICGAVLDHSAGIVEVWGTMAVIALLATVIAFKSARAPSSASSPA
jgi:MFS transporter, PPP family, 3-phenylpropionic acid transporter